MAKQKKTSKTDPDVPAISTIQAVIAKINKHYGAGTIRNGSEYPPISRIPTGIPWLDFALGSDLNGVFGIPRGRITLFSGDESSCKTLIALLAIAHEQTVHPESPVFFSDVEGAFDSAWARKLGVRPDAPNFYLNQPDTAEQGLDIMDEIIRSMDGGVYVLDSVAMLTPTAEVEESTESWQRGLGARLVNKGLRKMQSALNKAAKTGRAPACILINQERTGFNAHGGAYNVRPYGKGQDFAASVIVEMRHGKEVRWHPELGRLIGWKKDQEKWGEPIGRRGKFYVSKNKTAPPLRRGEYELYTAHGGPALPSIVPGCCNEHEQVFDLALSKGILQLSGSWYSFDDKPLGQGRDKAFAKIKDSDALYGQVYSALVEAEHAWADGEDAEARKEA